jgi:hypothetical protein
MNKNISILVLENDNQVLTTFDLTFKNNVLNYKSVKNVADFYSNLMAKKWDFVFLTHDLIKGEATPSADPNSGYQALVLINEEYALKDQIRRIYIHSRNQAGVKNMQEYAYVNGMDNMTVCPFGGPQFKGEIVQLEKALRQSNVY